MATFGDMSRPVASLLTDSRSAIDSRGSLFFALHTSVNDGHRYIADLYRRGQRAFVASIDFAAHTSYFPEASFLCVDNVGDALLKVGSMCRAMLADAGTVVCGITGSKAKTVVKEWLYNALSIAGVSSARSPRSYNSQIGVPLSLWHCAEENSGLAYALIEAGISRPGEMERLAHAMRPDIGVFTMLDDEHGENFESAMEKCSEKFELFRHSSTVVYNLSDHVVATVARRTVTAVALAGWSSDPTCEEARFVIEAERRRDSATLLRFIDRKNRAEGSLLVGLSSAADIEDASAVVATMLAMDIDAATIETVGGAFAPVTTRIDVVEGRNNATIIHDCFGSDCQQLASALDFMARRVVARASTSLILGDFSPSPTDRMAYIAGLLKAHGVDRVMAVGAGSEEFAARLQMLAPEIATMHYPDEESLISDIDRRMIDFDNQLVMVKGNSCGRFAAVVERIELRRHETVLEVNLDAVIHNFNFFKSRVRPSTGIVCMVKASGYGAGAFELARTLQSQGAAYLAVAVLDEGVELRRAGITMPIMVLNPRVVNYDELFDCRLEPEVFSFDELDAIVGAARRRGITGYPIHIKLDTGMHRLGFLGSDIPRLVETLQSTPEVEPRSVFSHLAAADDPSMDDYTLQQFALFDEWCDRIQAGFDHHILRHILNSTGITRFPEHQHDMVRLGICLYGVATMADGSQRGLRPVSALYTNVISVKEWPAGTTIGYNRRGVCRRDSRIATIPIGYADGIDRHLGNGAMHVWINGHSCPTIGNICMDACMIDVTDCGADCCVGTRVEVFGPHVAVSELSDALSTIPYEMLTSVSTRVKRVYFRE